MSQVIESLASASGEQASDRSAIAKRLIGELGPYKPQLLKTFALIVLSAAAQAGGPWLIGRAIDQQISRGDTSGLMWSMVILLAIYVGGTVATRAQVLQVGTIGQHILASLRTRLFERFQRLPLIFFDRRPIGDLMSRVTNDVDTLNQFLSQGITQLLGSFFSLIGIVIAMLFLNWRLALVSYTIIPLMLLTTSAFASRARRAFRTARETTGNVTAELQEEISGIREAQAFNRTEFNIERFRQRNAANRNANVSAVGVTSGFAPAMDVLSTLATALVIGYGGYLAFRGDVTVGVLTAFLIYVQQFFRPIQLASQVYTQAQASLAGAERIYAVLDEPAERPDAADAIPLPPLAGDIRFEDVTFSYEAGRPVLRHISFAAEAGQTIAIVGPTGAGKTTIVNLIPRFYEPDKGSIYLDGHDISRVTRRSLRTQLAMVLQEPFLFAGTVAENIAYGMNNPTPDDIESAAKAVDADRFIREMPSGYDTVLGERGAGLSEGQRQLLSFARAILADARILILDEATSRIDTRTEQTTQRALATVLTGRTSIVIAHRLSTVRNADAILVVEEGRIAERGTHAELIEAKGLYAELYRRQFRDGLENEGEVHAKQPEPAGAVAR